MTFVNRVNSGDKWRIKADFINPVVDKVNALSHRGGYGIERSANASVVKLDCHYTGVSYPLKAGTALQFSTSSNSVEILDVHDFAPETGTDFCILLNTVYESQDIALCAISGAVPVQLSGLGEGNYVVPNVLDLATYDRSETGTARILSVCGNTAIVQLGSMVGTGDSESDTPTLEGQYVNDWDCFFDDAEKTIIKAYPGHFSVNGAINAINWYPSLENVTQGVVWLLLTYQPGTEEWELKLSNVLDASLAYTSAVPLCYISGTNEAENRKIQSFGVHFPQFIIAGSLENDYI